MGSGASEVTTPLTMPKRSPDLRMTSASFHHVDQFSSEHVSLVIPEIRLWIELMFICEKFGDMDGTDTGTDI